MILKAILAYGTISQLGLIVTFLGYGGKGAIIGATLHLYNHAAAKAAMFMTVGIIDHEAGTRDVRLLGNLRKLMPKTHILAVIAALSLIGIPPMGGFITKEMLYEVSLHPGGPGNWSWFWPYITVFAGVFTALYHLRFLSEPYWQAAEGEAPKHPHDPPLGYAGGARNPRSLGTGFRSRARPHRKRHRRARGAGHPGRRGAVWNYTWASGTG